MPDKWNPTPSYPPALQIVRNAFPQLKINSMSKFWELVSIPHMFAMREQWNLNNAEAGGGKLPPHLLDLAGFQNAKYDKRTRRHILVRTHEVEKDKKGDAYKHYLEWVKLVPPWADSVAEYLEEYQFPVSSPDGKPVYELNPETDQMELVYDEGIPFSVELLASPEINLSGKPPLFPEGERPASLFVVNVQQSGERGFLRSMGADDLMREVWPIVFRYNHRPAGSAVPFDLKGGLSFGSPAYDPTNPFAYAGYVRTALWRTDAYQRWQKAGFPD